MLEYTLTPVLKLLVVTSVLASRSNNPAAVEGKPKAETLASGIGSD